MLFIKEVVLSSLKSSFELPVYELLVRIVQDPEDVSAQFSCTMPQGVVMRLALRSFELIVSSDRAFLS